MKMMSSVLIAVIIVISGASAQKNSSKQKITYNLGKDVRFILNNGIASVRHAERMSTPRATLFHMETDFWAYQLRTEFAFLERYVLQGKIVTGKSSSARSELLGGKEIAASNYHLIGSFGIGYRLNLQKDVKFVHPYVGYQATVLANYKILKRTDQRENSVQTTGLEIGIETSTIFWDLLTLDGGIYYMPVSRISFAGAAIDGHKNGTSYVNVYAGVGLQWSQYLSLVFAVQQDNVLHRFENDIRYGFNYPSWSLSLKTML